MEETKIEFENEKGEKFKAPNLDQIKNVNLSGILKLLLFKYIVDNIENLEIIQSKEIKNIILDFRKNIQLNNIPSTKDKIGILNIKSEANIISYLELLNLEIKEEEIKNLINLFDIDIQNKIKDFQKELSKYEFLNKLFENELLQSIKESYFDYYITDIYINLQNNINNFIDELSKCNNCVGKTLFNINKNESILNNLEDQIVNPKSEMNNILTDNLDYISFFCGDNNDFKNKKIIPIPINKTFSFKCEIVYYNKNLKKYIYGNSYDVNSSNNDLIDDKIKNNFKEKIIKKNGIYLRRLELLKNQPLTEEEIINKRLNGKFIGKEYFIKEKEQILPLYCLTLKRNEYCIIWRDQNFSEQNKYKKFLREKIKFLYRIKEMNIYLESSSEKALEIIKRKKYNKIILISNIGEYDNGKEFVEIARKILGFNIVVLFFTRNIKSRVWIKEFPNALYTNKSIFFQKYIKNYSKEGLLSLKKEIEECYDIELNFTEDFIEFPKTDINKYENIIFDEIYPYFRKVLLKRNRKALIMNNDKTLSFISCNSYEGLEIDKLTWYIIIINNEMTLFSNNFYLGVDEKEKKVVGEKYQKKWNFEKENNKYFIYYKKKENILTIEENKVIIKEENEFRQYQLFYLLDLFD